MYLITIFHIRKNLLIILSILISIITSSTLQAATPYSKYQMPMQFHADAPEGASVFCRKAQWACSPSSGKNMSEDVLFQLAKTVNLQINRKVRQIEDIDQYGVLEHWALPGRKGGDCEDFALLKKRTLLEQGVPSDRLLIATALDKSGRNHAVLIVRTTSGDYVLDNKTNTIKLWNKTGYSFLKIQDPDDPKIWRAVLAGGIFR